MISASLAVDRHAHGLGIPPHHHLNHHTNHHHHHHHQQHQNAHNMTFGEPFLLGPSSGAPPPTTTTKPCSPPEFLRPLPKPRYNGAGQNNISSSQPLNGCRVVSHSLAPRVSSTSTSKYHHHPDQSTPVNPVNLSKDENLSSSDEQHQQHFNTPSSYRFPITQPYYQGPYLYPPHYTTLMTRGGYPPPPPPHQQQQQQPVQPQQQVPTIDNFRRQSPPAPSSPGQFLPPTSTFSPPQSPSVKAGQSILLAKRFKVPSGKEGSLKHRILTRPAEASPKKRTTIHAPNFTKGSLIQLANGDLKRVEDMRTEDFINSAEKSEALRLDPSTVVRIEENQGTALLTLSYGEQRSQVDFETPVENPFFVFGQGWSSFSPERSFIMYGLKCHRLQVGDICISLTPRPNLGKQQGDAAETLPRKRRWSAPEHFSDEEGGAEGGGGSTAKKT